MHEQKLKHAHLTQKGESEVMRSRGSMLTEGSILVFRPEPYSVRSGNIV